MRIPDDFKDKNGLIGNKRSFGLDHGDAAQRWGLEYAAYVYYGETLKTLEGNRALTSLCIDQNNSVFIRHPEPGPDCGKPGMRDFACWNNPKTFSRDQQIGIQIGMSFCGYMRDLKNLFKAQLKRFGFHQNKDLLTPAQIGSYARSFGWGWVCWLTDPFLLLSVYFDYKKSFEDTSDILNGTLLLMQADAQYPTWFSKQAIKLAKKAKYQQRFNYYFENDQFNGAPPFPVLYDAVFYKLFKK